MSSNVSRTLTITYDNCTSYLSGYGDAIIHQESYGYDQILCLSIGDKTGGANLTDTAKSVLYPNGTAHPISASCSGTVQATVAKGFLKLTVNGTQLLNKTVEYATEGYSASSSAAGITSSTRSSTVNYDLQKDTALFGYIGCSKSYNMVITMTFTRYDFTASGDNCSVSVSSSTGYDGDTVTFTAVPNSGCTFLGWYKGDTRVTTSRTYTHTVAGADLTLTAKATVPPTRRRYLLCGSEIKLGDEISENISVTYGSRTLVENLNGSKTLLCRDKYMADKVYAGTRSANCADSIMPYQMVAMLCYGDWMQNTALQGGAVGYVSQTGWCVTPFLPVPDGCTNITIEAGGTQSNSILHEFDGDFGYLSYWGGSSNPRTFSFDYPTQIKYIRASFLIASLADCYIKDNTHGIYIFRGGNV